MYQTGGIAALKAEVVAERNQESRRPFLLRVVATDNSTLFLYVPPQWRHFHFRDLESGGPGQAPGLPAPAPGRRQGRPGAGRPAPGRRQLAAGRLPQRRLAGAARALSPGLHPDRRAAAGLELPGRGPGLLARPAPRAAPEPGLPVHHPHGPAGRPGARTRRGRGAGRPGVAVQRHAGQDRDPGQRHARRPGQRGPRPAHAAGPPEGRSRDGAGRPAGGSAAGAGMLPGGDPDHPDHAQHPDGHLRGGDRGHAPGPDPRAPGRPDRRPEGAVRLRGRRAGHHPGEPACRRSWRWTPI